MFEPDESTPIEDKDITKDLLSKSVLTITTHEPEKRNEWQAASPNNPSPCVSKDKEKKRTKSNPQSNPTTAHNETRKTTIPINEKQTSLGKRKSPSIPQVDGSIDHEKPQNLNSDPSTESENEKVVPAITIDESEEEKK